VTDAVTFPGSGTATERNIAPSSADRGQPRSIDFGLVVGVDDYPQFLSLQGAVEDATQFHAWLCDEDGGGLAPERARLVKSSANPVAPLQEQVDAELFALVKDADAVGGGRRLYFHFSGHGAGSSGESSEDVALLLATWSWKLAWLALSTDKYRGALGGMGLFEEIVISLDCCRVTAKPAVGLSPTLTHEPQAERCSTRIFVAYATEAGRPAFEDQEQGLWQGVFTRRLLTILRRSPNGISAAALKCALECELAEKRQQAHVLNGLLAGSKFGRKGTLPRLVITFEQARGRVLLTNGFREVMAEHDVSAGPWDLRLEAGLYKLEDRDGRSTTFEHDGEAVTCVEL
jgi:hypothetical protein